MLDYNRTVKTWDVVIIGGGVIGLSLAWRLRQSGAEVLVVEKGEPAREATHAAGGMIAHCDPGNPPQLAKMIAASARLYPEFVTQLRAEAFASPDLRTDGAIAFFEDGEQPVCEGSQSLDDEELARLEPLIAHRGRAYLLPESSIDPRKLGKMLEKAAHTLGVDFVTGVAGYGSCCDGRPHRRRANREVFLWRIGGSELRRRVGVANQAHQACRRVR